ncbi:MAG: alpha/beta fold hydrolase [Gammaproteobacteria bacterium]|nr:alpha/beta fold hydrolase [Gammaproteobacteria bacterium]
MDAQRLSQLIGLIYDSSVDLDLWPMLLQGLAEELESGIGAGESNPRLQRPQVESIERLGEYVSQWYEGGLEEDAILEAEKKIRSFSGEESQLIQLLLPHFVRALRINLNFVELNSENQAFSSVLERLPIGMAICDNSGRVHAKNRRFDSLLEQHSGLVLRSGRLNATDAADNDMLRKMVSEVASEEEGMGQAMRLNGELPSSVMILPLKMGDSPIARPRVIVFLASLMSEVDIDPRTLASLYGLTKAESRLTLALVNGSTLDEISEQYHVSKHTLRTQLKSVYSKTDCRRQAELVVKVLTSPALLAEETPPQTKVEFSLMGLPEQGESNDEDPRTLQHMYLGDGRRLSFAEYGPEDGYPTIMMHGLTGSRLQLHPNHRPLYENNIRLFIPERPGYGYSDSQSERTILDWNRDLDELSDFLELERFALMGYSVGGSFAMAAAAHFGERVSHLSLVSSMGQYHDLEDLDGMLPMFRMLLGLGKFTPSIAMALMRLMTRSIRSKPDKYFERIIEQSPQMDKEVLSDPDIQSVYTRSVLEAARQGERDMMLEQLMMARDWGFSPREVEVPVTMWHGELDRHVPLPMARAIQAELPRVKMKLIQGAGHFLIFRYWPEIVSELSESVRAA